MIQFIDIPTEQTTAVTDAVLALLALVCMLYLYRVGHTDRRKRNIWLAAYGLLFVGAGLGAVAHGFRLSPAAKDALWQPLFLSLGLTVAVFVVAVVYDAWGWSVARRVLWPMLAIGVGFYGLTRLIPGTFRVFIGYEAVAMLFALLVYGWLAYRRRLPGAGWMALGILTTIIAAVVQATETLALTFIWPFDYNGLYHLIQMAGILLLLAGLRAAFRAVDGYAAGGSP